MRRTHKDPPDVAQELETLLRSGRWVLSVDEVGGRLRPELQQYVSGRDAAVIGDRVKYLLIRQGIEAKFDRGPDVLSVDRPEDIGTMVKKIHELEIADLCQPLDQPQLFGRPKKPRREPEKKEVRPVHLKLGVKDELLFDAAYPAGAPQNLFDYTRVPSQPLQHVLDACGITDRTVHLFCPYQDTHRDASDNNPAYRERFEILKAHMEGRSVPVASVEPVQVSERGPGTEPFVS